MKAIAYDKYGPLDVLALRDIERPAVKDGEVLMRVRTAGPQIAPIGVTSDAWTSRAFRIRWS
jgi:NADPH:quinone reductase-like Zn-dependent oxidoreductase